MNENPLTHAEMVRYARILRSLLASLDREVVFAALVGERESDFLDAERELVDSLREFLDGRVLMPLQLDGKRGRGLALLDAFEDEVFAAEHESSSRLASGAAATARDGSASLEEAAGRGSRSRPAGPSPDEGRAGVPA